MIELSHNVDISDSGHLSSAGVQEFMKPPTGDCWSLSRDPRCHQTAKAMAAPGTIRRTDKHGKLVFSDEYVFENYAARRRRAAAANVTAIDVEIIHWDSTTTR